MVIMPVRLVIGVPFFRFPPSLEFYLYRIGPIGSPPRTCCVLRQQIVRPEVRDLGRSGRRRKPNRGQGDIPASRCSAGTVLDGFQTHCKDIGSRKPPPATSMTRILCHPPAEGTLLLPPRIRDTNMSIGAWEIHFLSPTVGLLS